MFFSLYTRRIRFLNLVGLSRNWIILIQLCMCIYVGYRSIRHFSDWFGYKWHSAWCKDNPRSMITIRIRCDSEICFLQNVVRGFNVGVFLLLTSMFVWNMESGFRFFVKNLRWEPYRSVAINRNCYKLCVFSEWGLWESTTQNSNGTLHRIVMEHYIE